MTKITPEMLLSRKADLDDSRAAVIKQAAPLRDKREKLLAKLQPLEEQLRETNARIQEVELPLYDIDQERSLIARMLPGSRNVTADETEASKD